VSLRLTLKAEPEQRLDLSPLLPERLAALDLASIEQIPLNTTRVPVRVGDLFRVQAGDASEVVIEGGASRFDSIGAGMTTGRLLVEGDVGLQAGRRMTGGRLEIRRNVGHWAASGMRGGEIEVQGDAGDFLGAPLAGERAGMAGGVVVVRGRAGDRAGDRLRRGIIIVEGDAGRAPASRMLAGTLIVCGSAGPLPGYLMRRGTLVLGSKTDPGLSFAPTGAADGVFLTLLSRTLRPRSVSAAGLVAAGGQRYAGDLATLGKGELILAGAVH
jgi:formylmethanofuran dehydrogenase subunit C